MTSRECSLTEHIKSLSKSPNDSLPYGTRSQENIAGQVQMDLRGEQISSAGENDGDGHGGVFSADLKPPHNRRILATKTIINC